MKIELRRSALRAFWLIACLQGICVGQSATADILYDTLPIAYPNAKAIIGYFNGAVDHHYEYAFSFEVAPAEPLGSRFRLDSYGVKLNNDFGDSPDPIEFNIFTHANGQPGTLIDTFSVRNITTAFEGQEYFAASTLSPVVTAGETYWVAARYLGNFRTILWHHSLPNGVTHFNAAKLDGGDWSVWPFKDVDTVGAFRIEGTPVPEPSAAIFVLLTFAILGSGIRHRKGGLK